MYFQDNAEMDEFVKRNDYVIGDRRLCFGVTVAKSQLTSEYDYFIRFNTTRKPGSEDIPTTEEAGRVKVVEKYLILLP